MSLFTGSLTPFSYIVTSLVDIVFLNVFSIYCLLSSFPWILRIFSTYFFIVFKNLFNRKLTTLQYCGGFSHTLTWISLRCTCVPILNPLPPPSPSHPSGLSQCTGFECPVSCIQCGLVIYFTYGNIHVSKLFSQIIPPLPSPRVQKAVRYICVSLAVSHRQQGSLLPSF